MKDVVAFAPIFGALRQVVGKGTWVVRNTFLDFDDGARPNQRGKSWEITINIIDQYQPISTNINHFKVISDSLIVLVYKTTPATWTHFRSLGDWVILQPLSSPCPRASDLQRASTVPAPPKDAVDGTGRDWTGLRCAQL